MVPVQDSLNSGDQRELAELIARVQLLEKEKLTQVAGLHLDRIRASVPAVQSGMGMELVANGSYSAERIIQLENQIRDLVEDIHSRKCDLV